MIIMIINEFDLSPMFHKNYARDQLVLRSFRKKRLIVGKE